MKKINLIFPALLAALMILFSVNYAVLAVGDSGTAMGSSPVSEAVSDGLEDVTNGIGDIISDADDAVNGNTENNDMTNDSAESDTYGGNISTDDNGAIGSDTYSQEPRSAEDESTPIDDTAETAPADNGGISWVGIVVTIVAILAVICIIVALVPKKGNAGKKED